MKSMLLRKGIKRCPVIEYVIRRSQQSFMHSWDDFDDYCAKVETSETKRSELVDYLEKGRLKKNEVPKDFSCLEW